MIEKKDSLSNSGDTFGNEPQASRKCSRAFDSVVGEAGSATPSTKQTYRKRGKRGHFGAKSSIKPSCGETSNQLW